MKCLSQKELTDNPRNKHGSLGLKMAYILIFNFFSQPQRIVTHIVSKK